jgi:Family of unknown function (DUF6152)
MSIRPLLFAGIAAVAGLCSLNAVAHHAVNAQFDVTKQVTLVGELTKFVNVNPHCYWYFDIKSADGAVEHWAIESVAPGAWRRAGLKFKEDVNVGQSYTFVVAPGRIADSKIGLMLGIKVGDKMITLAGPP